MADGTKYRYPGPQEFEDTPSDSRRFFGRNREIATVAERIVASRLLVVYGSSGLGKSSLLKAGVFPKLRDENLFPIRVRLNTPRASVLDLLKAACAEGALAAGQEFDVDYTPGKGQTAWEFFKTVMFWRGERLLLPVLVFDQFEEIFTLVDPAWRQEFGREVGPLAAGHAPLAVRERLRSGEQGLSDQAPKVKIVICLREEYYGSLQDLSPQFPGLFQDRFRLRPLDARQAALAIEEPARLESGDPSFATPPFEYESAAVASMLEFLRDKSQSIEPVPLQLLCQYVEKEIVEGKRKAGSPILITPADLGGKDVMNKVIGRFYKDSIDRLPAAERRNARELCDTGLLAAAGNRLLLEKNQIIKDYKVSDATLRYLTDERRILRQEPRLESTFYEISHDTIARSIFESRKWRLPKQWRRAAAVSVAFMIALLGIAGWALHERDKAIAERKKAYLATQQARVMAVQAETSEQSAKSSEARAKQSLTKAEGMVAFLMGEDFLAKLRPMGRVDVFEDMQKAVRCQAAEDGTEYSDVGLRNLGLACLNEGDVAYAEFRLTEANQRYETARQDFSKLAQRNRGVTDASLAEALFKMARVAADQLDLDRSLDLTRQSLKMQEQLVAAGSKDEKLLRDRASNYYYLGDIRKKQGYLSDALTNFQRAVTLSQGRSSTEWLYIQQDGLDAEGEILARQRYADRADESMKKAYEFAKQAALKSPFAPEAIYRQGVELSRQNLTSAHEEPEELLAKHLEVSKDVASASQWDPENKQWERDLAATHVLVGEDYVADKQWDKAAEHYRTAITMAEKLLALDPTNRELKADLLVWIHQSLGLAFMRHDSATLGKFEAAIKGQSRTDERDSATLKAAATPSSSLVAGAISNDSLKEFVTAQSLLTTLEENSHDDLEIKTTAAGLAVYTARLQLSASEPDKAIETCDRALRKLVARDATDSFYWEYKHELEEQRGAALHKQGKNAEAAEAFRAAATNIEWLLTHFPPTYYEWNHKFLFLYDHLGPLHRAEKDSAGELSDYQQALVAVEKAVALRPEDEDLQDNLALANQRVGDLRRDSGNFSEAEEHYAAAERAFRHALQLKATAEDENHLFLVLYDRMALIHERQKDEAAALQAYRDSLAPIMKAVELDPTEPVYRHNLALAQQQIGDGLRDSNHLSEAQEHYSAAENGFHEALNLKATAEDQNQLFLLLYDHVAPLRKRQKDEAGVWQAYVDSLAPILKAAELEPANPVYHSNLALAQQYVGDGLRDAGKLSEAEEHYVAAEKGFRDAVRLKPVAEYWHSLFSLFYNNVTELREKQKDDRARLKAYQDALDAERHAATLEPTAHDHAVNLAQALLNIGRLEDNKPQALDTFRSAVDTLRKGMTLLPDNAHAADRIYDQTGLYVMLHDDIAPILHDQNDTAGELKALNDALTAAQAAAALGNNDPAMLSNLGTAYLGVGDLLRRQSSDRARAFDSYVHSEEAFRQATRLKPTEAEHWNSLALAYGRQALVHEDQGESIQAKANYRDALKAMDEAGKLNPDASMKQYREDVLKKLGSDPIATTRTRP